MIRENPFVILAVFDVRIRVFGSAQSLKRSTDERLNLTSIGNIHRIFQPIKEDL